MSDHEHRAARRDLEDADPAVGDHEAAIRDLRAGLDEGLRRQRPDEVERARREQARREAAKDRADAARDRDRG